MSIQIKMWNLDHVIGCELKLILNLMAQIYNKKAHISKDLVKIKQQFCVKFTDIMFMWYENQCKCFF